MNILHVDLDAFFASVEERNHPEYVGKPVIVGGKPEDVRGVVATCNYKAREFGLHSAMPIKKAYELCPDGIYVRPDFKEYSRMSKIVMSILAQYADRFQQVSIDEAYLDITTSAHATSIESIAKTIQQHIQTETGLSCSVGGGSNKHIAKIASDIKKPAGITIVQNGDEQEFLAKLPIRKLMGVGPKTEIRLKNHGINQVSDITKKGAEFMQRFGSMGQYLYHAALGEGSTNVSSREGAKSISKNRTFFTDTNDRGEMEKKVDEMVDGVIDRLVRYEYWTKTIGIRVRYSNFDTFTRDKTIEMPTQSKDIVKNICWDLLTPFFDDEKKIRLLGVKLSGLVKPDTAQKTLTSF